MTRLLSWILKLRRLWRNISEFFEYDIWDPTKLFFRGIGWFFHNIRVFWKTLIEFRDWDHAYCVNLYITGLNELARRIENGVEESRSATKKVAKIRELIKELERDPWEEVWNEYEKGLFDKDQVGEKTTEREKQRFNSVVRLLRGQDQKIFDKKYNTILDKWKKDHPDMQPDSDVDYSIWVSVFDGSGCDSWWE